MPLKIYQSGNLVYHENTDDDQERIFLKPNRVYKWPRNAFFYSYDDGIFSVSRFNFFEEFNITYTLQSGDFIKKDGSTPTDDDDLRKYLDDILGLFAGNYSLEIAAGNVPGKKSLNKFGRAVAGVQTSRTDIWDRADATPTQSVWLAPTAPRIHTIASTSAQDAAGGTGVATVLISYLATWDTKEAVEIVSGNLNGGIAMTNAAVIIHRMVTVPQTTTANGNVGIITATAASDGTVTAQINANEGQTQMAIYGIPSTQSLFLDDFYGSINKAQGAAASINFELIVNSNPQTQTVSFVIKNTRGLQSTGNSSDSWRFDPPYKIEGPAIIKVAGTASASDVEASAGFNATIVDD